ncbi:MAG: LPS export ABC transporter periplasmic protein LptC [Hyphomicrobiales bacterium]
MSETISDVVRTSVMGMPNPAMGLSSAPEIARASDREKFFKSARRHSLWVRFLRICLPFFGFGTIAGLLFVTTFVPKIGDLGLDLGDMTLSFNGSSIMMNNPKLNGFGDDGQAYEIKAESATQSILNPEVINLSGLLAKISLEDGTWADVRSTQGLYDNKASTLMLDEEIKVNSSEGYRVTLQNAEVDLKAGTLVSDSPVEVQSETGFMQANGLIVDESGQRIRFTKGIRVLIVPPKSGGKLIVQE